MSSIIHLDDFYMAGLPLEDYDTPASIHWEMIRLCLDRLRHGLDYSFYPYNKSTNSDSTEVKTIHPSPLIIIEGLFAMHARLHPHYATSIFIRPSYTKRLMYRLAAYAQLSDHSTALTNFHSHVDPGYIQHIRPTGNFAKYQSTNIDYEPLFQDVYALCAKQIDAYNIYGPPLPLTSRNHITASSPLNTQNLCQFCPPNCGHDVVG